jgi:hypothetical protein
MKRDVLNALSGMFTERIPSKETLNHPEFIEYITGINPFDNTPLSFKIAWEKAGIDIHVPLPKENALPPTLTGTTWQEENLKFASIGVYPTSTVTEYCPEIDKSLPDWIFNHDVNQDSFLNENDPVEIPETVLHASFRRAGGLQGEGHLGTVDQLRQLVIDFNLNFGEKAVMYHLYYTTLFMFPVVKFGWESFLTGALMYPDIFDKKLWEPWSVISRKYSEVAATLDTEVVFFHDDLVSASGPYFDNSFYEKYIFSRYNYILEPVVRAGKKIVFVCDGNLDIFLDRLLLFPFDGLMFENPATPFRRVLDTWGKAGRGFIGGISTVLLTTGTPQLVRDHTREVIKAGKKYPGFIISSCGGLHGNIPMENMLTYFKTRNELGIPAEV